MREKLRDDGKREHSSEKDVNMQESTAMVPLGYKESKEQEENIKM